jgi:hypothetical protein
MGEPTKRELEAQAEAAGIDTEDKTKPELEAAIDAAAPPELGPVIPEPGSDPELPKAKGSPTRGVQPRTADEIPEAGR